MNSAGWQYIRGTMTLPQHYISKAGRVQYVDAAIIRTPHNCTFKYTAGWLAYDWSGEYLGKFKTAREAKAECEARVKDRGVTVGPKLVTLGAGAVK